MKKIINKLVKAEFITWSELKNYEFNELKDNSNRDITKLKNSIINQGFSFALCNWYEHRFIIDGAGRRIALLELEKEGYPIPDILVNQIQAENLKEAKKLAMLVSSQHGQITQDSLANFTSQDFEIEELQELNSQVNLQELDILLQNLEIKNIPTEIDEEIPELKSDPFVVRGDIFEILVGKSKYRIGCLDSTNFDEISKLFDGEKIDLVFADPPYGVNITKPGKGSSINNGKFAEILGDKDTSVAKEFYQNCQSFGIKNYILWGGNYFTDFLPPSRCWIIWDKKVGKEMTFARGEMAWANFNKNLEIYEQTWSGNLCGKVDLEVEGLEKEVVKNSSRVNRVHPTQKPVKLQIDILKDFDQNFTNIFDGFSGGGTTLLMGIQTQKNVFASELTEYYAQVSVKRCVDFLIKNNLKFEIKLNGQIFNQSKLN